MVGFLQDDDQFLVRVLRGRRGSFVRAKRAITSKSALKTKKWRAVQKKSDKSGSHHTTPHTHSYGKRRRDKSGVDALLVNPVHHSKDARGRISMDTQQARARIADAIRKADPKEFGAWEELKHRFQGVRFVAFEIDDSTFDITKNGKFFGRTVLLLDTPYVGFGGDRGLSSISVPADIQGVIKYETGVRIQNMELRL